MKDFIEYVQNYEIDYILPGENELTDLKNSLYSEYGTTIDSKQNKFKFLDESYIIVDAFGWLRLKNDLGKL